MLHIKLVVGLRSFRANHKSFLCRLANDGIPRDKGKFVTPAKQWQFLSAKVGQYRIFGGLLVTFSKLVGKKVIGANAYTLGEMLGADVDASKWQITHLHVSLSDEATRELGFRKPFLGAVVVCLPVNLIQAIGDVITLNKSIQELRSFVEPKKHE